jgi:hypothetical protein
LFDLTQIRFRDLKFDKRSGAATAELRVGKVGMRLPNKFPTSAELNSRRLVRHDDPLPGEFVIAGRLMSPDSLKKLLTDDSYMREFARRISHDTLPGSDAVLRGLFLVFRGDASYEEAEDLRTLLDLQYYAGMDVMTVQQTAQMTSKDFASLLRFAERWMDQRRLDKPIMPILLPNENREVFTEFTKPLIQTRSQLIGFDMHGGFHYQALRVLEQVKRKLEDVWIHTFQVPPKIRWGGRLMSASEGMMLPYFGVDSFSRWVVPPPPEPLTKDKINMFNRKGWGVFKRKEWRKVHGKTMGCSCPMCKGRDLDKFFLGEVLAALSRAKIHDHYAQQDELRKASEKIREGSLVSLIRSKKHAAEFVRATAG